MPEPSPYDRESVLLLVKILGVWCLFVILFAIIFNLVVGE